MASKKERKFLEISGFKDLDFSSGGLKALLGFRKYFKEVSEEVRTFFNRIHTRKVETNN
jgi:hypothetical protein